jgi:hypothetical protein
MPHNHVEFIPEVKVSRKGHKWDNGIGPIRRNNRKEDRGYVIISTQTGIDKIPQLC